MSHRTSPLEPAQVVGIDASRAASTVPTGTEGYSYHLIKALLPRLVDRYRVRLYFRSVPSLEFSGAELRVIPLPRLWTHLRLSWEMVRQQPALLFVPAHVLPLIIPARTVVTVHDLGYLYFPHAHTLRQRAYLDWSTRRNARLAAHVLADSVATRDALIAEYGTSPEKISVAYPGYDQTLKPVRDPERLIAVRERYGIPGEYLLYLGSIQPRKNLVRLIRAFAQLLPRRPGLSLVLAGKSGWLSGPIYREVRALDLEERVIFAGYIAEDDKAALLSGARCFAFPSLYEGFGFPVLEAQACETPLLASTTSSLPEVVGEGGLLVDPLDESAIARGLMCLLEDEPLRRNLVARGKENLRRFSWDRTALHVTEQIQSLLSPQKDEYE